MTGSPSGGIELKLFDPGDASTGSRGSDLLDATLLKRDGQWWMYLAGQAGGYGATEIFRASLPAGASISETNWTVDFGAGDVPVPIAAKTRSQSWDGQGGRHCPSYVRGYDPHTGQWVDRIYYAGAAENLWGPYAIGFLHWDGETWIDQPAPVFTATENWEHGSVYEPNLIYHDGRWKMWYVAGSNQENYIAHGYAESIDGVSGWSQHAMFAPPEMKMFDFRPHPHEGAFHAIFARVWLKDGPASPETGLWWCTAAEPSSRLSDWSQPVQIMTAEDKGWHSGPWKPSFEFDEEDKTRAFVFFDGVYRTNDPGPFPFVFTLGRLEITLPPVLESSNAE